MDVYKIYFHCQRTVLFDFHNKEYRFDENLWNGKTPDAGKRWRRFLLTGKCHLQYERKPQSRHNTSSNLSYFCYIRN